MTSEYQIVEKLSGQYGSSNTDGAARIFYLYCVSVYKYLTLMF